MRQRRSDHCQVPLVVGMHGDRGVPQHGLDAGGRHHDVRFVVVHRAVPERHQFALDVLVLDLEVGDRGLQHRRPIDQALGLIDQPGVVKPLEDGPDGPGQAVVHGEPVAAPVDTVAERAHLPPDGAAGLALPFPHLVDEQLAAEVLLGLAVDRELFLDHALGGDACVVHAGQPQHLVALHALATGQRIHQRVIQRVAHVQIAGDVRRRKHDRIRGLAARGVRGEVPGGHPTLVQVALYRARIPRLGQRLRPRVVGGLRGGSHLNSLGSIGEQT